MACPSNYLLISKFYAFSVNRLYIKGFPAFWVSLVRRLTAATAAVTLASLFTEQLCYVLGSLHSSCVLSTRFGLHRIEVINKTLVNDDFFSNFLFIYVKSRKF